MMKNVYWLTVSVVIFISFMCPATGGAEAPKHVWSIGYAEADITPAPKQVQMSGFGRERYAQGTLAPLLTQVVALKDRNGCMGILITADILGFDRVMVEAIRRSIHYKHHVPAENILFAASHTHWGPAVRFHVGFGIGAPNVWYLGYLEDKILASVDSAMDDLSPATIEYGSMDFRGIGCNRRRPVNGKIGWGPYREGSFDGHTPIFRIKREGTPQKLVLVGHACHPTSSGSIQKWSPDYPGAMRDRLVDELSDTKAMFFQGCGGDAKIVHNDPETGKLVFSNDPEQAKAAGEKLAEAILKYLQTGPMIPLGPQLACSLASGRISYGQRWSQEEIERQAYPEPTQNGLKRNWQTWAARQSLALPDASESFRYDVQVWKLGTQLMIFGMEGEICSPWGPMLRSMAPTEQAMVVGYANNTGSYIPDKRIVREGGYEGLTSQQVYFLPAPFTEKIDDEIKQIVTRAISTLK
ncbi:MAG: neutral/alkaline non-lysosomal ceramidase N-terminal domain-containing protein [Sedimentisphaerales bacterium]|nr:neutral/alkaline non-lysosomal ceramidase N-terminal domain-containing protein [Sedimentisphaerales bacterium]